IAAFCQRAKGLTGVAKAAKATKYAHDRSRSPMETAAILLFTLPQQRGGYSLSGARLNRKITLSPKARKMAGINRLEPDIAWPKAKIIVEYDSKAFHNQEARISNDARRKNAFTASGFQVITLTSSQLNSKTEMDKIAAHIAAAAKKRVRIAKPATFYAKQKLLRMELLHCDGVHRKQHALPERAGQQVERTKKPKLACRRRPGVNQAIKVTKVASSGRKTLHFKENGRRKPQSLLMETASVNRDLGFVGHAKTPTIAWSPLYFWAFALRWGFSIPFSTVANRAPMVTFRQ
ncbi:MAG: DUF559 domain-containing protein, partial [Adlercreutzia equolifaciens]